MVLVNILLVGAFLAQPAPPFTETFGPDGQQKTISQGYVSCDGRDLVQTVNAFEDLIATNNDIEASYALSLNKCSFISKDGPVKQIQRVLDKRCISVVTSETGRYCRFEYYLFELRDNDGHEFYAIYAPIYD